VFQVFFRALLQLQRSIIRNQTLLLSKLEFAAEEYAKRPIKKTALFFAEKSSGIDLIHR
jgi:hypothetical protein